MRTRGTKAEKARRVHKVCQMLLREMDRESIILAAEQLGWNVSTRTIDTYMAAARRRIEEAAAEQRTFLIGQALARFGMVFGEAFREKDYRSAISAENSIVELFGLKTKGDSEGETMTVVDEWLTALREEP